ncbi:hypothetical protein [Aquimarina algicola]|uniref:Lipoprotein n=1 Tax=Aquimarina algicola TaxID=2589995 RepID=A0A504JH17_9FLAO|nr:hypothetical protein [Aquimarina algicola]TPN86973.1 hypothetical protein FHK87_05105 [Aquimarina algicola]
MKKIYTFKLTVFMLFFVSACGTYTPKSNHLSAVLSNTQQAMTDLKVKIPTTDKNLLDAHQTLEQKIKELFPLLRKCNEKYALTKPYMATLEGAEKSLTRLHKDFDNVEDKISILSAIHLDYDAKLKSIQNNPRNEATTKIIVTVDSSEDEGFFVFGKLSFEQGLNIKRFRFNRPTQNASQEFVPGYYLFWLEKENRISEPELHLIVGSGKEKEEKKLVLKTPK